MLSALFSLFLSGLLFFEVGIAPVGIVGREFVITVIVITGFDCILEVKTFKNLKTPKISFVFLV